MSQQLTASLARAVLRWPRALLALLLLAGAVLVARLPQLDIDVSSRTLLGIDHPALKAWRETAEVFHLPEQVMVTVAAPGGLRNAANRALLDKLQKDLAAVPDVAAVTSVLDAPLVKQVRGPLAQLESNRRTLRSADVDLERARQELITSPLFRDVLISADGRNFALLVTLRPAPDTTGASAPTARGADIAALRAVLKPYAAQADIGLIGAAVLADEVAGAVRADVMRLPLAVLVVMLLLIAAATRRPPVLEFACGGFALLTTAGLWQTGAGVLGAVPAAALPIVVVIAVLLSFTLRVSYKLHVSQTASDDPHTALAATVEHALTASLPASGVLLLMAATLCLSPLYPAHQLGALLLCGLGCAWLAAFGLGPCLLAVAKRRPQALAPLPVVVPARWLSVGLAAALAVAAVGGMPRFIHEADVASYLPQRSASRQALHTLEHLYGGALSFDLVLNLPPTAVATPAPAIVASAYRDADADPRGDDAWFTSERVKRVEAVHRWLAAQPGVGRVLSLASLLEVGQQLNDDTPLSPFEMNLMYKRLPRAVRSTLIDPFVQPRHDQARLHVRMQAPPPGLTRAAQLSRLEQDLESRFKLGRDDYRLSGAYVVYAHMADLLPPTLVVVGTLAALARLALVILSGRTPRAASRLLMPTLIAALGVMGVAGWHHFHLDMLTVAASGVAFALFVQIRTAGRRLIDTPAPQSIKDGTAPPPIRDPYGSTVSTVGIVSVGAGLATLGTADFAPAARFGLLCGAMVALALLASQRVSGLRRHTD
ncbi:MAG: MMPL family transporter [Gammaproteobacteria bacterium]|nr:MMPL family transporter [Gammaproteobacteria bacterium]